MSELTHSPFKILKVAYFLCSTVLIFWFTWSGHQFLAHNVYNDADSSFFIYGGITLNNGGKLYQDFWDLKPPAIFYQNAILLDLLGLDLKKWAYLHMLIFLSSLAWGALQLKNLLGAYWVTFWAIVISFGYNLNNYLDSGNRTEFGVSIFEFLSMTFILSYFRKENKVNLFLSGLCCSLATMYKPIGLASILTSYFVFLSFTFFFKNTNDKKIDLIKNLIYLTVGFLIGAFFTLLPVTLEGNLQKVWDATITLPFSQTNATNKSLLEAAIDFPIKLGPLLGFLWPILLFPLVLYKTKEHPGITKFTYWMLIWNTATFSGIVLMRHGHPHYYQTAIIPGLTLAFLCIYFTQKKLTKLSKILLITLFLISGLIFSRYFILKQAKLSTNLSTTTSLSLPYIQLSQWLNSQLKENETFYYWSMGYSLYIHSQKECPGRLSPSFLILSEACANLVIKDLDKIIENKNITYLIENPNTYPKNLTIASDFPQNSLANLTIQNYLHWRDNNFQIIKPHLYPPFILYERK